MINRIAVAVILGALAVCGGSRGVRAAATPQPAGHDAAGVIHLVIKKQTIRVGGREVMAKTINGSVPGPTLRLREGEPITISVTNELDEPTSLHWHGVLVPTDMDGVPGVSFPGIKAGETFTYRYTPRQSGTYWYHSHSDAQEQSGVYGPLLIEPANGDPFAFDRDYVVMLSDWSKEDPNRVLAKLKKMSSYYNFKQLTVFDFFREVSRSGWKATLADRMAWGKVRMDPTDIADVTGYATTYLVNGRSPDAPWSAVFKPGERVRLRFINAGATTHFDVRIPGLKMSVVQADGQNVQPVTVDEFRIAPAESYDVVVEPQKDDAYAIFAETMDRSGYAAAFLAQREGGRAPMPQRRERPLRTMADMGMGAAAMGEEKSQSMPGMDAPKKETPKNEKMSGMVMPSANKENPKSSGTPLPVAHGPDHHGPGNSMVAMMPVSRLSEPGVGLGVDGRKVLVYTDLRRLTPDSDERPPEREIEMHLTGNMGRQMWSIDGISYSDKVPPIPFRYGERLRVTLVNDTMMDHPMHVHGMWMVLENGAGARVPNKHTINVKAGEKLSFLVKPDELGKFAYHCHLLYHMELGMFRVISVFKASEEASR
jgi:CopA family copper-resistance protein